MNNRILIGRCGLYCGACTILRAQRDDKEWRRRIAERRNCLPEQVRCNGCGALTHEDWGYDCRFAVCLRGRGYEFCFQCPEFNDKTCEEHEKFSGGYLEDGVDLERTWQ